MYVDGVKIGRIYSEWQHIPEKTSNLLSKGVHTVKIVLMTNDHVAYTVNGVPIQGEISFLVK